MAVPRTVALAVQCAILDGVACGVACTQGRREYMEDRTVVTRINGVLCAGVFDGHGGSWTAEQCAARLPAYITLPDGGGAPAALGKGLAGGMLALDAQLKTEVDALPAQSRTSGSTALLAGITPNYIVVANCGDCRAALVTRHSAFALSRDHKPTDADESARINAAGSFVSRGRVGGILSVSRGLGDFMFKRNAHIPAAHQAVSPAAEVHAHARTSNDLCLVLASDGVWDVLSVSNAGAMVRTRRAAGIAVHDIAASLVKAALALGSSDNLTAIVVALDPVTTTATEGSYRLVPVPLT